MIYLQQHNTFIANGVDDKTLRQALKAQGIDARRFSRFTQLALLGALSMKECIQPHCGIYLGSPFNSPSKFDKMFHQLNEQNVPSPLDFMANINNAATFQLAQTLQTTGNSIFLPINEQTIWQPLELAKLDLMIGDVEQALVGWVLEASHAEQKEGSVFWLISTNPESAVKKLNVLPEAIKERDFLSIVQSAI